MCGDDDEARGSWRQTGVKGQVLGVWAPLKLKFGFIDFILLRHRFFAEDEQ